MTASTPAIYECRVRHVRSEPFRHSFSYRTWLWLVDLDHLPDLPWLLRPLASFKSRDHLGRAGLPIRENVERFASSRGVELAGGRVLMLAHARSFGFVFNSLTVYWCYRADGALGCVIAEVHNTYSERHCYLLRPDSGGEAKYQEVSNVAGHPDPRWSGSHESLPPDRRAGNRAHPDGC